MRVILLPCEHKFMTSMEFQTVSQCAKFLGVASDVITHAIQKGLSVNGFYVDEALTKENTSYEKEHS